jgi:N-acetylmuramoyl-L-alanine amidase
MIDRPILFSVAHSSKASGARSPDGLLSEYMLSLRATLAAIRNLAGEIPVEFLDVGPLRPGDYVTAKVNAVNRCAPALAVEIHANAAEKNPRANYGEVIHHRSSVEGKRAAALVCKALSAGYAKGNHQHWPVRGARANSIEKDRHPLFFLELTKVPAVIVEGVFLSNLEQAAWLQSDGGPEAYGLLVAAGLRRWAAGDPA